MTFSFSAHLSQGFCVAVQLGCEIFVHNLLCFKTFISSWIKNFGTSGPDEKMDACGIQSGKCQTEWFKEDPFHIVRSYLLVS